MKAHAALALALAALALGGTQMARAASPALPRLEISPSALSFSEPGESRTLTLRNAGDDVLRLGGVSIVTTGERRSTDFLVDAPGPRELEAGASATLVVTYRPPPGAEPAQLFGSLLLPADDPELPNDIDLHTGTPIARRIAGVALRAGQTHVLTWMILLPLLGAGLVLRAPARRGPPLALASAAVPLALAAWVIARFDPTFSAADGNHGLQLVAHLPLVRALGFEYFVGVDGVSLLFVLLAPLVGAAAVAVAGRDASRAALASVLLVQAGATGVFVAQDGLFFALFWGLAAAGLARLGAARGVGAAALGSAVLLFLAVVALRGQSSATYLVDGTPALHSFDLTKLGHRAASASSGAALASVLLVAFALVLPLFPFSAPAGAGGPVVGLLFAGLATKMAIYGLARLGLVVLPGAAPFTSTLVVVLLVLGALGALRAALLATRAEGLGELSARAGDFYASVAVLGVASLAPAGIVGALALAFAQGLVVVFLAAASPWAVAPSPRGRLALVAAVAASLGVPGLATFVGAALIVVDAAPRNPGLSLLVLAGFAILTGAHARVGARLLAREPAADAPAGDASSRGRVALGLAVALGLLLLALGLVPIPVLGSITTSVLDLARLAS